MERVAILIGEMGGAGGVVFGVFFYLFKSTFKQMVEPLSKSIIAPLSYTLFKITEI